MTAAPQVRTCPNCHADVRAGARQCSVCKLAVSQMDAFAAAKAAARKKGLAVTRVETGGRPLWSRPIVLAAGAIVILLVAFFLTRRAAPPPWTRFPITQIDAAKGLLTGISTGTDEGFDRAYALVAPSVKNPKDSDELGEYRQFYLEVNKYLAGEFGQDWITTTTFEPDPANTDLVIAHVGVETLHITTALQTPADKLDPAGGNRHYAVTAINEFDISTANGFQQIEGVKGGLRMFGAGGAIGKIEGILNAGGASRHETSMQTKFRLLPSLRNPRDVNKYEVYQTWPVYKDPVIRRRLDAVVHDDRYGSDIKQVAQAVLNDAVSDEELIAAHVQD